MLCPRRLDRLTTILKIERPVRVLPRPTQPALPSTSVMNDESLARSSRDSAQSELGPAPQHVVGSLRPFVRHQIADLGRRQVGAEVWSEIVKAACAEARMSTDPRAVGARQAAGVALAQERTREPQPGDQPLDAVDIEIATRQRRALGPVRPRAEHRRELAVGLLRETAIGRDLAAIDRQQRRLAGDPVELQHVVARRVLRLLVGLSSSSP